MRDWAHVPSRIILWREVVPMDMESVLTLMISFGMLIAFIMSDKDKK